MNVWLITIGEPLPLKEGIRKLRTAYLAEELISRGHQVVWWTSAFDHLNKQWFFNEDTEIALNPHLSLIALKGCGYQKNISLRRLIDHRMVAKKFKIRAKQKILPDIIIVSLPTYDLACEAVKFANRYQLPVMVDIRDKWPDIFLTKIPLPKPLAKAILFSEFSKLKTSLKKSSHLIAVSERFMSWGLKNANRRLKSTDKVYYLGYKKDAIDLTLLDEVFRQHLEALKTKFVVTFIGTFEEFHDPSNLIDCAQILKSNESIQFVLAGDGKLIDTLKNKAKSLKNVLFTGWLDQAQINALLEVSHIGVCTTKSNEDLFPNKAFSYFAFGLPIISSFQGDLAELCNEHHVGFYCAPNDVNRMAECIQELQENVALYQRVSENSRALFQEKMDGTIIYKQYASHIENALDY